MKRILLLYACILACGPLFAQNMTITGKVIDYQTKDPVMGATVTNAEHKFGGVTNEKGLFSLRVPKGKFSLEAAAVGYSKSVKSFTVADTVVLIELKPSSQALQEVVVTGMATKPVSFVTCAYVSYTSVSLASKVKGIGIVPGGNGGMVSPQSDDEFAPIKENRFQLVKQRPLSTFPADVDQASESFRLAAAVAQFGMVLRKSGFAGKSSYAAALGLLGGLKGADAEGDRTQFVKMIKQAMALEDIARQE